MESSSLTLTVPADKIGSVIGPGGSGLRRLGQEAGVKVTVPRTLTATGERSIEMVGLPEQLQRAQQLVLELMEGGKSAAAGMTNKRKLPLDFIPGTYSRPVQQCFYTPATAMLHAPAGLPSPYMTQPQAMLTEHMGSVGTTPLEARLILDGDKVGSIVGKAGAGLKQLREGTGSTFTLTRDLVLGGRMLIINPPLDAQQRCITSICDRLVSASDNSAAGLTLKLLVPSNSAGVIIGKGGNGLKELRSLGVTVDMAREDVAPGERLLTTTGPAQAVSVAVNTVVAKMCAA